MSQTTSKLNRKYCLKKDTQPKQHHILSIPRTHSAIKAVDLRSLCPPIYNQGELGSCTANALAGDYEFNEIKEKEKSEFTPSRLFIYYNERAIENTTSEDSGASLSDGIQSISTTGVCPESEWPYDVTKFSDKPPAGCYTTASSHKANQYKNLQQNLQQLKQSLIDGYPFICGITVYESFESDSAAQTGVIPLPNTATEQCLGGHATMYVGFNDTYQTFIGRNSWGTDWGAAGYFYIPYAYLTNPDLACDFWSVRNVADA